jgi:DNA invertase Pin-like site-specific DNA recombinase
VFLNAGVRVGQVKSDERQRLEDQRGAIAAACRRRGWRLVEVVEQAGLSAKEVKRPGSQAAPRLLKETGEAKALVAANKGRLSRLVADLSALIATAHKQGWALVALDCAPETTGPAGEPEATLLASFAPCERSLISQRIRQALAGEQLRGGKRNVQEEADRLGNAEAPQERRQAGELVVVHPEQRARRRELGVATSSARSPNRSLAVV